MPNELLLEQGGSLLLEQGGSLLLESGPPTVTCTGSSLAYTAGSGAQVVDPGIVLATDDPDEPEIVRATIVVDGATLDLSGTHENVGVASGAGGDVLTLEPTEDEAATVADMQAALRAVTVTIAETSGTFNVQFLITDIREADGSDDRSVVVSEPPAPGGSTFTGTRRGINGRRRPVA